MVCVCVYVSVCVYDHMFRAEHDDFPRHISGEVDDEGVLFACLSLYQR